MRKYLLPTSVLLLAAFASCEKGDEPAGETNKQWSERNTAFIDSLANVYAAQNAESAQIAEDDTLFRITPKYVSGNYIYYKKIGRKEGFVGAGETAKFTDYATVYYKGFLIDGTRFDGNFDGEYPDYETDIPYQCAVAGLQASTSGVIFGWTEVLQHMRPAANATDKRGDFFRVYIPSGQAYGPDGSGSIPGNSALIFDMNLVKVE